MLKKLGLPGLAALMLTLSGCMHVDYTGQHFPELPPGTYVTYYAVDDEVPAGEYHAIGRATLTAPDGTGAQSIRAKLMEDALAQGADAVAVKEFVRVKTGEMPQSGDLGGPTESWKKDGRNLGGDYIYSNSFGEVAKESKGKALYEVRVKALYLVNKERFESVTREYKKELRTLDEIAAEQAKNPATAATVEELLKMKSPVKPEDAAKAAMEVKKAPEVKAEEPVQLELQSNESPVTL